MPRVSAEVGSAANSYEILAKLAMGGMAEIFLARGASTAGVERYVVLKRVLRDRAKDQSFIRMFLDEARLAAQLQHPNIAQVYDIGKLGDSYFFTMEYVHGETVRTLLHRSHSLRRPIPIGSVLTVIAGAAAGLHHAHDRKGMDGKPLGIVHRDVSPSNLMISYEGTVKVVDFGVAKAAHRDTETRSGTVKGKISYLSPEQCRGAADIDRRSDIFALGIVMWEMLTTERLFRRASDFENMTAIVNEQVPPPSTYRPEIPAEIDGIVLKMLAKDPAQRFQTADEVHEAIENAAVRSGSALSAASLGRFMRELFGQRPEPWIELQTSEALPEPFTVTSESIGGGERPLSAADELDKQLSAVPELVAHAKSGPATAPPPGPSPSHMMTVPLRVQVDNVLPMPPYPRADTAPPAPPTYPRAQTNAPSASVVPTLHGAAVGAPTPPAGFPQQPAYPSVGSAPRPHTPSFTPPSSPHYHALQSSSQSGIHAYGAPAPAPAPTRRSRALVILIPAIVLGIAIGVTLAVGGDKKPTAANSSVTMQTNGADPGSATPVEKPAVETNGETNGDKPADPIATPPVDTKPTDTKPADTTPVEAKPVDTKPVDTKPADTKPADTKPADTKPELVPDVAVLFKAGRFTEALAACGASAKVVSGNPTVCTVAACKARDTVRAKKWFASVAAAKRANVIKDCGGVLPPDKTSTGPTDECKRDPLACQH